MIFDLFFLLRDSENDLYMLHFYQISAWVFLIHMLLYAGFYCSDTNLIPTQSREGFS